MEVAKRASIHHFLMMRTMVVWRIPYHAEDRRGKGDISLTMPDRSSRLTAWQAGKITLAQESPDANTVIIKESARDDSGITTVEDLTFVRSGNLVRVHWYYRKETKLDATVFDDDLGYCHNVQSGAGEDEGSDGWALLSTYAPAGQALPIPHSATAFASVEGNYSYAAWSADSLSQYFNLTLSSWRDGSWRKLSPAYIRDKPAKLTDAYQVFAGAASGSKTALAIAVNGSPAVYSYREWNGPGWYAEGLSGQTLGGLYFGPFGKVFALATPQDSSQKQAMWMIDAPAQDRPTLSGATKIADLPYRLTSFKMDSVPYGECSVAAPFTASGPASTRSIPLPGSSSPGAPPPGKSLIRLASARRSAIR